MGYIHVTEYILFIIMSPTAQASLRHIISGNYALMGKCGVYTFHRILFIIMSPTANACIVPLDFTLMDKCGVYV